MLPKIFIVLQETSGQFGSNVVQEVIKASKTFKNLVITPSKSGKMTKNHIKIFFNYCIKPYIKTKSLILLDSFSGHKKKEDYLPDELINLLDIELIPEGTTSLVQPLDVFFFRQFKLLLRKIIDLARQYKVLEPEKYLAPHLRMLQLKTISIVQQFKAPIFMLMIKGAFNIAGYNLSEDDIIEKFKSINELLFEFTNPMCDTCINIGKFIRCGYCRLNLCFNCFLNDSLEHFHFEDNIEPTILDYDKLNFVKKRQKNSTLQNDEDLESD
jgi:hypothetical protein